MQPFFGPPEVGRTACGCRWLECSLASYCCAVDRIRAAGLQGLQGVIRKTVSDELQANIWDQQHMDKIVPSLLYNMHGSQSASAASSAVAAGVNQQKERPVSGVADTSLSYVYVSATADLAAAWLLRTGAVDTVPPRVMLEPRNASRTCQLARTYCACTSLSERDRVRVCVCVCVRARAPSNVPVACAQYVLCCDREDMHRKACVKCHV